MLTSYEIQTKAEGRWKIAAIFDDRELAVYEAKRMADTGRYASVRVVQETFGGVGDKAKLSVLYRSTPRDEAEERRAAPRSRVHEPAQSFRKAPSRERRGAKPAPKPPARKGQRQEGSIALPIVLTLIVLIVTGVGAYVGLQFLLR